MGALSRWANRVLLVTLLIERYLSSKGYPDFLRDPRFREITYSDEAPPEGPLPPDLVLCLVGTRPRPKSEFPSGSYSSPIDQMKMKEKPEE